MKHPHLTQPEHGTHRQLRELSTGVVGGGAKAILFFVIVLLSGAACLGESSWSFRGPAPVHENLTSVLWHETNYVATGAAGGISCSPDGEVWISKYTGFTNTLLGIASGNGRLVAVGAGDKVLVSDDGENWAPRQIWPSANPGLRMNGIMFGRGRFVAFGDKALMVSTDGGDTWQTNSLPSRGWSGAYGGGIYVVAGVGFASASSDGTNWTTSSTAFREPNGLTYMNGEFLEVGSPGVMYTSTNGLDWQSFTSPNTGFLASISNDNGKIVAGGTFNPDGKVQILTSTDGRNWSVQKVAAMDVISLAGHDGQWVGVTLAGTTIKSEDGDSWFSQASFWDQQIWNGVAVSPTKIVTVGDQGVIGVADTEAESCLLPGSGTTNKLLAVTYGDGKFVAMGDDGVTLVSTNGTEWIVGAAAPGRRLSGVTYLPEQKEFFALGSGAILSSLDGFIWKTNRAAFAPFGIRSSLAAGNGVFAAVLDANSFSGSTSLLLSSNEQDWTSIFVRGGESISFGNGGFVVMGGQGQWFTSTNGSKWDARAVFPPRADFTGSSYRAGEFLAVDTFGLVISTMNRVGDTNTMKMNWSVAARTTAGNAIAMADGIAVAAGRYGKVAQISAPFAPKAQIYKGGRENEHWICAASFTQRNYHLFSTTDFLTWQEELTPRQGTGSLIGWPIGADQINAKFFRIEIE